MFVIFNFQLWQFAVRWKSQRHKTVLLSHIILISHCQLSQYLLYQAVRQSISDLRFGKGASQISSDTGPMRLPLSLRCRNAFQSRFVGFCSGFLFPLAVAPPPPGVRDSTSTQFNVCFTWESSPDASPAVSQRKVARRRRRACVWGGGSHHPVCCTCGGGHC